jgi:hypothetical protein
MKFSMTGQEKGDLLIQVTINRADRIGKFVYHLHISDLILKFYVFIHL